MGKLNGLTLNDFNDLHYIEDYLWYDGPLFYRLQDSKGTNFICYILKSSSKVLSEFIVEVSEEEIIEMKSSFINEWFNKLFNNNRIFIYELNFDNNEFKIYLCNKKEFDSGLPKEKVHFNDY